jgi:hypothetical protein
MTHAAQVTDTKTVYTLPREINYRFSNRPANETIGSIRQHYVPLPVGSDVLGVARELTLRIDNKDIARRARKLLSSIQEIISIFQKVRLDLSYIPPLRAFEADDGSVLFEWSFRDYRIGFSIEPDPQESGWYLITNQNLGEISAAGHISGVNLQTLIIWLFSFIIMNS